MPKVRVTRGPEEGKQYEFDHAVILGRLDSNDIPVKDGKASREHAKIYKQGQSFAIVDLNSSNGTFVNGDRVTKRVLEPGDVIGIGMVRLEFSLTEEEQEERKPKKERRSLDEAFDAARSGSEPPGGGGGGGAGPEVVMRGHKPLQYRRVKPGKPLLGFDFDQLSDEARVVLYLVLLGFFALVIYISYRLVAG